MRREPAAVIGTITAIVTALLALAVAFGVDLSEEQRSAILALVATVAPIAAALLIRRSVWSPASHEDAVTAAHFAAESTDS